APAWRGGLAVAAPAPDRPRRRDYPGGGRNNPMSGVLAAEVLVLGASGRVGSGVVAALLEAGSPGLAVGRDAARLQRLAALRAGEPGLELMVASVAAEQAAGDLARRLDPRPRRLRAVVDATAGIRRATRLLAHPVPLLAVS